MLGELPGKFSEMYQKARFLPLSASAAAPGLDRISLALLGVSVFFSVLIFFLLAFFAWKYRRRAGNELAHSVDVNMKIEAFWTAVPLAITIGFFAWGAHEYLHLVNPPSGALPVYIVGKQWMWEMEHTTGAREINQLHVPAGRDVELIMISQDVIHSFFIPDFRMKFDVLPGRYTHAWFHADRPGNYRVLCTQYCGTDHSEMIGSVNVMPAQEYDQWVQSQRVPMAESGPKRGERLFAEKNCISCHDSHAGEPSAGPSLRGLYGHSVQLASGESVIADEKYLRESILAPQAKIVAGYGAVMPPYAGQLSETDVLDLILYLRSLASQGVSLND